MLLKLYNLYRQVPSELRGEFFQLLVNVVSGKNPKDSADRAASLTVEIGFKKGYT